MREPFDRGQPGGILWPKARGGVCMIQTDTRVSTPAKDGTQLTVLNPMGYPPRVTPKDMAPRLDTLEGKRVFLVDCRFDDADLFLKQMQNSSGSPASTHALIPKRGRRSKPMAMLRSSGWAIEARVRRRSPCTR